MHACVIINECSWYMLSAKTNNIYTHQNYLLYGEQFCDVNYFSPWYCTVHVYRHSKFTTPTQVLSSLRVLLSLPPPTPSTPSQDLHKQAANGIAELVQARASLITQQSDWSILFTIIEYIGLGISPEQSSNVVAMETTEEDPDGTLQSDSSVTETQKDLVIVTKIPTINSFDLFAEPVLPVHEPQVL